ncbi:MAG TPA: 16S rRNA processing protein RimM, partial [Acetomicrobium sp.]|nr:16S rRNA processing protein RimM [Acetomicrobium sp.]
MSVKELVTIGRIVGAHGIKGEFRLLPLTDFPDRFNDMDHLDVYRP